MQQVSLQRPATRTAIQATGADTHIRACSVPGTGGCCHVLLGCGGHRTSLPGRLPTLSQGGLIDRGRDDENNANKKARVVWSVDMHQQFVNAVNQLGIDSEWGLGRRRGEVAGGRSSSGLLACRVAAQDGHLLPDGNSRILLVVCAAAGSARLCWPALINPPASRTVLPTRQRRCPRRSWRL